MYTPNIEPKHIAIIMDGNGRWAKERGLPRILGHRAGAVSVRNMVEASCDLGLSALTLYAFSWENWERPKDEVSELMVLLDQFVRSEAPRLHKNHVRLRAIGRLDELPSSATVNLRRVIEETKDYDRLNLVLALSYGGRQEIVDATRKIAQDVKEGKLNPKEIDEAVIAKSLYASDIPDPDLLIRTSGEYRLSNFLLWQVSYAEWYITPKFWPDFAREDLIEAINWYKHRDRRFGKTHTSDSKSKSTQPKVVSA